ncbi:MAG TPA: type II toxin-antitoxin system RelE/ParE family toxin [Fluviicola sp.]|nr:type II toxin-antitoxin system RelE/ParE family toxin [Fluviicola sp.]
MIEVIWSKKAEQSFDSICEYIRFKFSAKEEDEFVIAVFEMLKYVSRFPKAFPESKHLKDTRQAVIHPHTTLFYRIENKKRIRLLILWDNRNNPQKLKPGKKS